MCFVCKYKFRVTYGAFSYPLTPPPPILLRGGGWAYVRRGGTQHLRFSVGLLMQAMLRMMELRGLTNFGKRAGGGERRGDLGTFVAACLIWELKKKWPKDVVKMRELLLGSLILLFYRFE